MPESETTTTTTTTTMKQEQLQRRKSQGQDEELFRDVFLSGMSGSFLSTMQSLETFFAGIGGGDNDGLNSIPMPPLLPPSRNESFSSSATAEGMMLATNNTEDDTMIQNNLFYSTSGLMSLNDFLSPLFRSGSSGGRRTRSNSNAVDSSAVDQAFLDCIDQHLRNHGMQHCFQTRNEPPAPVVPMRTTSSGLLQSPLFPSSDKWIDECVQDLCNSAPLKISQVETKADIPTEASAQNTRCPTDWNKMFMSNLPPHRPSHTRKPKSIVRQSAAKTNRQKKQAPPTKASRKRKAPRIRKSKLDPQVKVYYEKRDIDVVFGQGGEANNHPGNARYLLEKESLQARYWLSAKPEKTKISQELVDRVYAWGGRFLKKEKCTGRWYEATNAQSREKASQCLRDENTEEVRKLKRELYGH